MTATCDVIRSFAASAAVPNFVIVFVPRPQKQVIGIAQDDLGIEIVQQIARQDAFDGPLGADGHENRRLDIAVGRVEDACARACLGADRL